MGAAQAGAHAAGHVPLHGYITGDLFGNAALGQFFHHDLRPAGDDHIKVRRVKQIGNKALVSLFTAVSRHTDLLDIRPERIQRVALIPESAAEGHFTAGQALNRQQKRRNADSAGHHCNLSLDFFNREPVSHRAGKFYRLSCLFLA